MENIQCPNFDIRELLEESDGGESDFSVDIKPDFSDTESLTDFLSESEEEIEYDPDEINSDINNDISDVNPRPNNNPWCRVYPPEQAKDLSTKFLVRNPGIKNCPSKNSRPLDYFSLFFSNFVWDLLVNETNCYALKIIMKKQTLGI